MLIYRYVPIDKHLELLIYNLGHHVRISYFDKGVSKWYLGISVGDIFLHAFCKKNLHVRGSIVFNAIRDHFLLSRTVYALKLILGKDYHIMIHIAGDTCLLTTGHYGDFDTNGTYELGITEVFELLKTLRANHPFETAIILEN